MNATLTRRTEPEIQALMANGAECLTVDVKDRFGSYGLTGVMMFSSTGKNADVNVGVAGRRPALRVDAFLLSCRALGRGVEHRMVARLGEIALERGLETVEIPFVPGQRNRPAALFLESLCAPDAGGVYRLTAGEAAAVKYRFSDHGWQAKAPAPQDRAGRPPGPPAPQPRIDYARIANHLREPAAILERIRAATRRAVPARASQDPPRTPIERHLAELWAALLNLPEVGIHDNFFDLGGHSLLGVQLISRVRQIYGVDLSLEVVYSGDFTVAELANAIELKEIEQAGGDYQDLLRELDGLSDEEARGLLAEERDVP